MEIKRMKRADKCLLAATSALETIDMQTAGR